MDRTHLVTGYRWIAGTEEDNYGKPVEGWVPISGGVNVQVNVQPLTGSVQQAAAGREVDSTHRMFAPAGTVFREDDAVLITVTLPVAIPYTGPTRFRVQHVGSQGGKWDTEYLLKDTEENIP